MENRTGRVLKADEVRIEGKYHLDIKSAGRGVPAGGNGVSSMPQVRIVENNAEYAVLELTCGCGIKTCFRCEYSDAKTS